MTEILGLYQYLSSNLALEELCVSGCVLKFEVRSTIAVEALLGNLHLLAKEMYNMLVV